MKIEIYTTPLCPFCWRAKSLLERKGVHFDEVDLWQQPNRREEMIARASGRSTVPQIFVGGHAVGGCDDLYALDARQELDRLLAGDDPDQPDRDPADRPGIGTS